MLLQWGELAFSPFPLLNLSNPLTPQALAKTLLYQVVGLGFGSAISYLFVFPWVKDRLDKCLIPVAEYQTFSYSNPIVNFLFGYVPSPWRNIPTQRIIREIHPRPSASVTGYLLTCGAFLGYFLLRASALIIILNVTGDLLTSVGWVNPLSLHGLYYDLIFARVNSAPNAAHISSYLSVCAVGLVTLIKFRKGFVSLAPEMVALIMAALTVALHEGMWISVYYVAYGRYLLDASLLPNIAVDIGFSGMVFLFILAYSRYKFQRIPLKAFLPAIHAFVIFLCAWYVVPYWINPSYYSWLPISTLNNWKFGATIFNETPWYSDPLTNGFESFGWMLLSASMCVVIWRHRDATNPAAH